MDPGVEITGRVTRGGVGVEGVDVNAFSQEGMANAVTGPDGSFRLADLTPGQMMLNVMKRDAFIQQMRPTNAPAQDVVIELPPGGRISGRVVDKNSKNPHDVLGRISTGAGGGGMRHDAAGAKAFRATTAPSRLRMFSRSAQRRPARDTRRSRSGIMAKRARRSAHEVLSTQGQS